MRDIIDIDSTYEDFEASDNQDEEKIVKKDKEKNIINLKDNEKEREILKAKTMSLMCN